eukprot:scaffold597_cov176-Amphora_coffeaeformis.AAC.25
MKKFIQQILVFVAVCAATASAFAPATMSTPRSTATVASMGLFDGIMDYFSDEAKAKREAEKQRMIEEQEEAYREVLERRRNPELMEDYMEERKERLQGFMGGDSTMDGKGEANAAVLGKRSHDWDVSMASTERGWLTGADALCEKHIIGVAHDLPFLRTKIKSFVKNYVIVHT